MIFLSVTVYALEIHFLIYKHKHYVCLYVCVKKQETKLFICVKRKVWQRR